MGRVITFATFLTPLIIIPAWAGANRWSYLTPFICSLCLALYSRRAYAADQGMSTLKATAYGFFFGSLVTAPTYFLALLYFKD